MNVISSPSFGFFSLTLYRKMSSRVGELPLSKKSFGFFDGCFAMVASRVRRVLVRLAFLFLLRRYLERSCRLLCLELGCCFGSGLFLCGV